ncbi:MAG: hydrogenase maturation nickel metallochaperone HypA [Planctomycetes bacterium]|nr:hydrogenase maturation nickel metallochaperone HypA [Planctomycetota bacterium]
MHETAVAQNILDTILEQANKVSARPVRAIISCGQFNALNDEVMQFAFEAAAENTPCQGMRLEIKHIPLRAKCRKCKEVFVFDVYSFACPKCKAEESDFEPDAPLLLEEIEFKNGEDS